MDLAKSRFTRSSEARRFSKLSVSPQFCESHLKIQRHLVQLLATDIQIANVTRKIYRAVGIGKWIFVFDIEYNGTDTVVKKNRAVRRDW